MVAGIYCSAEAAVRQHREEKNKYPGTVVFIRMGNFLRTFGEDALECSVILPTNLEKVELEGGGRVPMLGFTHHSAWDYLRHLLDLRRRVVIVEVDHG